MLSSEHCGKSCKRLMSDVFGLAISEGAIATGVSGPSAQGLSVRH